MKPLYGFMQDDRWYEDLGHVLIGLVPMWGWWREHRQWPPGDALTLIKGKAQPDRYGEQSLHSEPIIETAKVFAPLDRVADSYRDFMGYALGDAIRTGFLVGVIAWMI